MNRKTIFPCLAALTGWLPAMAVSADRIEPVPYAAAHGCPTPPRPSRACGTLTSTAGSVTASRSMPKTACWRSTPNRSWRAFARSRASTPGSANTSASGCTPPHWPGPIRATRPQRETRPRGRGPDPLAGARRLPGDLRARTTLRALQGADWDVWSHKYNLMGLLTYYQYTGNKAALAACRKMGNLLIATFPAKKSILAAGTHMGMAATSVLEPIVLLYRASGDERYLQFARYIVKSWDEPNGPKIIAALLTRKQVNKTANGKAYEMLSNLVGLCELSRASGDRAFLEPVLNAWQDIVEQAAVPDRHAPATASISKRISSSPTAWNLTFARLASR